jgi:hypothetical protein
MHAYCDATTLVRETSTERLRGRESLAMALLCSAPWDTLATQDSC